MILPYTYPRNIHLEKLSLDEPDLQAILILDDGKGRDEIESVSIKR